MFFEESLTIPLGRLKSGVVIHGSISVQMGSVEFFIVNEGNYSRWSDGLSCYVYSLGWSFNFTIPYDDEWYAVFDNPDSMFPSYQYEIHIGSIGFLTVIFTVPGIIVASIIGIAFIVGGRLEPTFEPTSRPIYREEITPKEVEPRKPEFICPDCGHANPRDADFCIRCGQDLDLTDEVSR
ncbi:MAG: zinc ribbon domain-containing protein [Candidatus Hodarchaeota archaeon]